jgi:hypothetical protein
MIACLSRGEVFVRVLLGGFLGMGFARFLGWIRNG